MKRLILTCSIIAAASIVSFGQSVMGSGQAASAPQKSKAVKHASTSEATAQKKAIVYKKQLGLNEIQYKAVYGAELQYAQDMERSMNDFGSAPGPGQTYQMQMTLDQKFKAALTSEQYSKYESNKPKTAAPGN